MVHCHVQRQKRFWRCVKSVATWWEAVRPTALTTPCLYGKTQTHTLTHTHTLTLQENTLTFSIILWKTTFQFSRSLLFYWGVCSKCVWSHLSSWSHIAVSTPLHLSPPPFPPLHHLPQLKITAALIPLPILICGAQYCLSGQISPPVITTMIHRPGLTLLSHHPLSSPHPWPLSAASLFGPSGPSKW